MLKYILSFSVFMFTTAVPMDFSSIIRDNVSNPAEIIRKLQSIKDTDATAEAFLNNFGGVNYQPVEQDMVRTYSFDVMERLEESALLIGCEMRKVGALQIDDETALVISKRFLEFANKEKDHSFVDEDISPSFLQDQLKDMIFHRRAYRLQKESLKKVERVKYQLLQIPTILLDDM